MNLRRAISTARTVAAWIVGRRHYPRCTCGSPARSSWQPELPPYEGWSIECPVHGCFDTAHTWPGRACPSCHSHFVREGSVPKGRLSR